MYCSQCGEFMGVNDEKRYSRRHFTKSITLDISQAEDPRKHVSALALSVDSITFDGTKFSIPDGMLLFTIDPSFRIIDVGKGLSFDTIYDAWGMHCRNNECLGANYDNETVCGIRIKDKMDTVIEVRKPRLDIPWIGEDELLLSDAEFTSLVVNHVKDEHLSTAYRVTRTLLRMLKLIYREVSCTNMSEFFWDTPHMTEWKRKRSKECEKAMHSAKKRFSRRDNYILEV